MTAECYACTAGRRFARLLPGPTAPSHRTGLVFICFRIPFNDPSDAAANYPANADDADFDAVDSLNL